jgi:hypothetical protein
MLAKDAGSADAGLFKERALLAAEAALPWERAHVSALSALLEDPYSNLAATEAYIAANPRDLLVISQLCGYLIFYGGARKLERVLNIMESVDPSLHDDWACLARLGFAASEAGDQGRGRELVVAEQSSDRTRLSLRLVEAVSQFASGQYADAADTLKLVSPDERVGVGGSRVERMLIDLLEARAVELAET